MFRSLACYLLPVVLIGGGQSPTRGADWPQWRGPNRNGTVDGKLPGEELAFDTRWTAEVGTGFSSIAIAGERIFTTGNRDGEETLWCLDAANGQSVWTFKYSAPLDPNLFEGGPTATPTVISGKVYAISRPGEIFCLLAETGEVVWRTTIPEDIKQNSPSWGYAGSPLVLGNTVLFNAGSHGLCLDAQSGEVIWSSGGEEQAGYTSPLLVQPEAVPLVLLESEKTLTAVDPGTGAVRWSYPWITRYGINAADPLLLGDHHLLVSSGYGKGTALLEFGPGAAEERWRVRNLKTQMSPGVVVEDLVFATDGDAGQNPHLVCLDPSDGSLRWKQSGLGSASLIAVGDQLLVLSDEGELLVAQARAEGFEPTSRQKILSGKCWTPPAYKNGLFCARNAAGTLIAVDLKAATAAQPK
jgi:outer membrane protein assembly factor BamB